MNRDETKQLIINKLEAKGLKHRKDFTISQQHGGYSRMFNVTLKNINYSLNYVRSLVASCESYECDEYTGEILSGGNTFIDVQYAYDKTSTDYLNILESYAINNYLDEATSLLNIDNDILINNSVILLKNINNINIYYIKNKIPQIRITKKNKTYDPLSIINYPDNKRLAVALARAYLNHYNLAD